jgi:hypothetical protein
MLEAHLAEFDILKREIDNRTSIQGTLTTVSVTATGIALGVGLFQVSPVIIVVPIVSACLGLLWLDNAVQIDKIGEYLRDTLRLRVARTCKADDEAVLMWQVLEAKTGGERAPRIWRLDYAVLCSFAIPGVTVLWLTYNLLRSGRIEYASYAWIIFGIAAGTQALFIYCWIRTMLPRRKGIHPLRHVEETAAVTVIADDQADR